MTPKPGELFTIKLPYESPINGKSGLYVKTRTCGEWHSNGKSAAAQYIIVWLFGKNHETTWSTHMLAGMHTMEWKRKEVN